MRAQDALLAALMGDGVAARVRAARLGEAADAVLDLTAVERVVDAPVAAPAATPRADDEG